MNWEISYKFATVTNETAWKKGDTMLWNSLGQFRKALIKIEKSESLALAPKKLRAVELLGNFSGCFVI